MIQNTITKELINIHIVDIINNICYITRQADEFASIENSKILIPNLLQEIKEISVTQGKLFDNIICATEISVLKLQEYSDWIVYEKEWPESNWNWRIIIDYNGISKLAIEHKEFIDILLSEPKNPIKYLSVKQIIYMANNESDPNADFDEQIKLMLFSVYNAIIEKFDGTIYIPTNTL